MSTAIEIPLILGGNGEKNEEIKPGDIVIVYETQENISYIYVEAGKSFDNRFGRFSHDSFIGKHFGDKVSQISENRISVILIQSNTMLFFGRTLRGLKRFSLPSNLFQLHSLFLL